MVLKGWNEDVKARRAHLDEMNAHEFDTDEAYVYWIENGIPDEASEDDLDFIAENIEIYNEVVIAFKRALIMDV